MTTVMIINLEYAFPVLGSTCVFAMIDVFTPITAYENYAMSVITCLSSRNAPSGTTAANIFKDVSKPRASIF